MMTDIEIARSVKPKKIKDIAKKLNLTSKNLTLYGDYICKVNKKPDNNPQGKLILVTAITPTSAGIGKTTVSIGLADGINKLGKSCSLALREPSLGPVFGIKGGATGGGYSQVIPMEDINLHFTGDFHAITSANNLLCAMIDNHIFQGNALKIDPSNIFFHRTMDMNDRALRCVCVGNTKIESPRWDSFSITSASEIMAIMCLSENLADLKRRLGNILIGLNTKGQPVYAKQLKCQDAMAILLKKALEPNLVQTLNGTPAFIHLGPFANIAHGCNSINATKLSMSLSDYTITEAGFGCDLGAEKFLDIKCRLSEIKPNAVVLVATIQALKLHGNADKNNLKEENLSALKIGFDNLLRHINTIKNIYNLPLVVTLNKYSSDTEEEIKLVCSELKKLGVNYAINSVWANGVDGAIDLAQKVISTCEEDNSKFEYAYNLNDSVEKKIEDICKKVYGADGIILEEKAKNSIDTINKLEISHYPICIAKTQYSFSDNAKLVGAPTGFNITIRDIEIRNGGEFLVAIAGDIMLMPGLSKSPAGTNMKISNSGKITGLF